MALNGLGIYPLGEGDAGGGSSGFEFGEAGGMGAASRRPFIRASDMDVPRFAMQWSTIMKNI
jgi:hypothetical protein